MCRVDRLNASTASAFNVPSHVSRKFRRTIARASGSPPSETILEIDMRMIVLVFTLIALAAPSHAAPRTKAADDGASQEKMCRDMVGKEQPEGEGRGGVGRLQAQRHGECMMGTPQ
jgi:hypothetical protein